MLEITKITYPRFSHPTNKYNYITMRASMQSPDLLQNGYELVILDCNLYKCIHTPMYPHTNISTHQCIHTPMYPHTNASTHQCIHTPMYSIIKYGKKYIWLHYEWEHTPMYSTQQCIPHSNVFRTAMYSTQQCIPHSNVFTPLLLNNWVRKEHDT